MRRRSLAAGLLAVFGCLDLPDPYVNERYKCDFDEDCLEDFKCSNGFCVARSFNPTMQSQSGSPLGAWYGTGVEGELCLIICQDGRLFAGDRLCTDVAAADFGSWCRVALNNGTATTRGGTEASCLFPSFTYSVEGARINMSMTGRSFALNRTTDPGLCGFCQAYSNHCPGQVDVGTCRTNCEMGQQMTLDDCYFAACGVELDGVCDNENDAAIQDCARRHGWR